MAHAHDEFPPLTSAAKAVLDAGTSATGLCLFHEGRRHSAAVIRAAVTQLGVWRISDEFPRVVCATELEAIADNLHATPMRRRGSNPQAPGSKPEPPARPPEQPFQAQLIRHWAWCNEQTRKAFAGEPVYGDAASPPPKPQPTGGRLIRSDVDPGPVAPATNASLLVEMVGDAISRVPWESQPQAAILAVAKWLRCRGNCGSASELEREAAK